MIKKLFTFLFLCILCIGSAWGEEFACTFVSPDKVVGNSITKGTLTWTIGTTVGAGSPTIDAGNSYSNYGLKFGKSGSVYFSNVTFTTDYFKDKKVSKVVVNILNNGKKSGTFTAKQGEITIGSETKEFSNPWTDLTATGNTGTGGTLVLSYSVAQCFFIHSIIVTYEDLPSKPFTITLSDDNSTLTETSALAGVVLPSRTSTNPNYIFVGWSTDEVKSETTEKPTIIKAGNYHPSSDITLYPIYRSMESISSDYSLISSLSDIIEGTYYIAALNNSKYYAVPSTTIAGQTFTCIEGSYSSNVFEAGNGSGLFQFTEVPDVENSFYIYNTELNKYLVATGSKTFGYVDDTSSDYGYWTFEDVAGGGFSGQFSVKHSSTTHYMRAYTNTVRCYDGKSNQGVYLFGSVPTYYYISTVPFFGYERNVTADEYGTICLPFASSETSGATFYSIAGKKNEGSSIVLNEVGGNLEAGTPYIFKANGNTITVTFTGEPVAEAKEANGLIGTFVTIDNLQDEWTELDDIYVISGTKFYFVNSAVKCEAYRAFIAMSDVPNATTEAKGDVELFNASAPTDINGVNFVVANAGARYNIAGQKVNSSYKGIVIMNGKKYLNK